MARKRPPDAPCCSTSAGPCCAPARNNSGLPKPALQDRPLLTPKQAGALAMLFKMLANDTRLRLLHALARSGELSVSELGDAVGMKPQAVSNQLQRLSDLGILASRRNGLSIRYRIADRCVARVLDYGLCLLEEAWTGGTSAREVSRPVHFFGRSS
jgi:ArsR family transcriptional regulator, lead/cadmium/zinc/bismuth-responsive transcriptional repressor